MALLIFFVAGAQTTLNFPIPDVWLKADVTNDSLNQWTDVSGNNNHAQANGVFAYTDGMMNFQPCLVFDSVQDPLYVPLFFSPVSDLNVFAVYKSNASTNAYGVWSIRLDSAALVEMSTTYLQMLDTLINYADSTPAMPALNMLLYSWTDQDIDSTQSNLKVVGSETLGFDGKIAEIMFYDSSMTFEEITKVHTYLAIKYGIGMEGMDYMNSAGDILWSYEDNIDYGYNIAGIGKDSLIAINQKQSAALGGDAILTISSGTLADWNSNNANELQEMDYLIWGDNGDTIINFNADTLATGTVPGLSDQQWLMTASGITVNSTYTDVRLYAPDILDSAIINLVINPEADFSFPDSTCIIVPADSTDTLGYIYFSNVLWDTDFSGSDAFTFQFENIFDFNDKSQVTNNYPLNSNNASSGTNLTENGEPVEGVSITSIDVFPNPSHGEYKIEISLNETSDVKLTIQDESGKIIQSHRYSGAARYTEEGFINGKGCYLILVETDTESKSIKFIVQ